MQRPVLLLVVISALVGCEGSSAMPEWYTEPADAGASFADVVATPDTGAAAPDLVPDTVVSESLGLGSDWYVYDPATHALSPDGRSTLVVDGDRALWFTILSYYNARGTSGYFALEYRTWQGDAWSSTNIFESPTNVKESPLCLDADLRSVDCADAAAWLLLRTDARILPAAGFAVSEPGIYLMAGQGERTMFRLSENEPPAGGPNAVGTQSAERLNDARRGEGILAPVVARPGEIVVHQATGSGHLAAWKLISWAPNDGAGGFEGELAVHCTPLTIDPTDLVLPHLQPERRLRLSVPMDAPGPTWISLCSDGEAPKLRTDAETIALWPSSTTFDVWIQPGSDRVAWIAAPGSLVRLYEEQHVSETVSAWPADARMWQ